MSIYAEIQPVLDDIVEKLIDWLPASWCTSQLDVKRAIQDGRATYLSSIFGASGDKPEPSEGLNVSIQELIGIFKQHGMVLKAMITTVTRESNGKWVSKVDFDYEEQ